MLSLFLSVLLLSTSILLPGYLITAPLVDNRVMAICLAPAVAVGILAIAAVVYPSLGLEAGYFTLMAPLVLFAVVFFLVSKVTNFLPAPVCPNLLSLAFFVVIAVCFSAYVVVSTFDGPDCYFQGWDNVHHLAEIQTFARAGNYSPFSDAYYTGRDVAPVFATSSFYPSAWHMLAAMLVSALSIPAAEAANAVNIFAIALVYPLGFFLCLNVFGLVNKKTLPVCAVICVGIPAFPWDMISYGPLYPNLLGLAFVPAVLAFIASALRDENSDFSTHPSASLLLVLPMAAALALTHPGALFSLGVIAAPLLISVVSRKTRALCERWGLPRYFFGAVAFLLICAIWYCCYKLPFLSGTIAVDWPAITSARRALFDAVTLGVTTHPSQVVIPLLALIGCLALLKARRNRWLVVSWAFLVLLYVIDAGTNLSIKHLLTGFWYTDYHRTGAMLAVVSGLLACAGLSASVKLICRIARRGKSRLGRAERPALGIGVGIFGGAVLAAVVFAPSIQKNEETVLQTPFGYEMQEISLMYDQSLIYYDVFSPGEEAFCKSLKDELGGAGSLVINNPQDGSIFAYSALGMNVYYRFYNVPSSKEETEDSKLIRLHLAEYASNPAVRDAVSRTGAKYVLQLDSGDEPAWEYRIQYNSASDASEWSGIESITPETEGFTLVKAEDDMRLYKIG